MLLITRQSYSVNLSKLILLWFGYNYLTLFASPSWDEKMDVHKYAPYKYKYWG